MITAAARASGGGAYDKYQEGDYKGAFEEYDRLAAGKTNDYRLHYNAGTSAYSAEDLAAARKQLDAALNTPEIVSDLPAQEHAYYNLGNTLYRLGEPEADPKKKQEQWEQATTNYSRALRLNTNDLDAKNNLAYVRQKLEELKQQQQQQQQQKNQSNDKKNQDQKNQQNQQGQDQKQQQQNQQGQDQKNQQNQQQQSGAQNQQNQQNQGQQQQQPDKKGQQNQSGQAKANKDGQQQKDSAQDQQEASGGTPAPMTIQQAQQMLDAQKDGQKVLIFSAQNQPGQTAQRKIKDW
jgi:Ca-activated chloride channel family protein